VHPLAVVLSVAAGSLVGGIGGAIVAVPLVAVANTGISYLRAYAVEAEMADSPGPHGATAAGIAPVGAQGASRGGEAPPPGPSSTPEAEPGSAQPQGPQIPI